MSTTWEAMGGMLTMRVGKTRAGKPKAVLMMQVMVCFSAADAKAVAKEHPQLKFVERTGSTVKAPKLAGGGE